MNQQARDAALREAISNELRRLRLTKPERDRAAQERHHAELTEILSIRHDPAALKAFLDEAFAK